MINDLINGIATKLSGAFGSDYRIYRENIKQGLKEPCFSIVMLEVEQSTKLSHRYFRSYPFDIHYFPKTLTKEEMYDVADKLLVELEYITVLDNLCRGIKMRYEIVDDVLHFFVNYDLFIRKDVAKVDSMENLTVNSKTGG